ncbi:hypothetical protein ACOMHN_012168 [Nucella lapillus]
MAINRLPIQEPEVFLGDALQYPTWKSSFEFLIERQRIASGQKILFLRKYVGGKVREALDGFFMLKSQNAFHQAMMLLETRFGHPSMVAQAFRKKLEEWPTIISRDPIGLRRYADYLRQCVVASQEVGGLRDLDDPHCLKRVLGKLPEYFKDRWARMVQPTRKQHGDYPVFTYLADFLEKEADICNNPVFGMTISPRTPSNVGPVVKGQEKRGQNFNVTLNETCRFCEKTGHDILVCRGFLKLPLVDRSDFVFKDGLCFGCLSKGHLFRECKQKETCSECKRRHPTCLHDPNFVTYSQRRRDSKPGATDSQSHVSPNASTGATTAVSHKAEQNSGSGLTAMVVPVYVSTVDNPDNEILTYALLDTMSNTLFVVQGLAEEIEASAINTTLSLSTMTDNNVLVKGKRSDGLRGRSAFGSDVIHLSSVISRPHIHIDPCLIPTPDTVKLLGHLQRIATELMPLLNCPAGLLIGYDHAEALMPVEVIQGTPFAIRTVLGWSVIGRPADDATCDVMGSTYHTIAPTDTERPVHKLTVLVNE